jgi:Predicted permeases
MMQILYFIICLFASMIGGICGVGGGVIIKPVLDATGTMSVSDISFLSGCVVLCMSTVSVLRNKSKKGLIDYKMGTPLAVGAIVGGIIGKQLFDLARDTLGNNNHLGAIQALFLLFVTGITFLYSVFSERLKTNSFDNWVICIFIGMLLGIISSFLGIGGGPLNLMILSYFFSMDNKKAAANSLYIIMLSQLASLFLSVFKHTIPTTKPQLLLTMMLAGVLGAMIGSAANKKISNRGVENLFRGFMLFIISICIYNLVKYTA